MKFIQLFSNGIYKLEKIMVFLLIPAMLLAMVLDIFFRYFLNSPLIWGQEVALYTFVWTSFIGASMSIQSKAAVAITIFVDRVNSKVRNILILIGLLISTLFCIYIFYLSLQWILSPSIQFQKSITTQIPMIYIYVCIPISLFFMSIHFIHWLMDAFQSFRVGRDVK